MTLDSAIWAKAPEVVGTKFRANGLVRAFAGNTVTSFVIQGSPLALSAATATSHLRASSCRHKLAFLPPSSWHMTVIPLICDQVRDPTRWTSKLPVGAPLDEVDAFMSEAVAGVAPIDKRLLMDFKGMATREVLAVELAPSDKPTAEALARYRDEVAERTGVRHPDHDSYVFHVSLAYRVSRLDRAERQSLSRSLQLATEHLVSSEPYELEPPSLTFFDDMFEFRLKRR